MHWRPITVNPVKLQRTPRSMYGLAQLHPPSKKGRLAACGGPSPGASSPCLHAILSTLFINLNSLNERNSIIIQINMK